MNPQPVSLADELRKSVERREVLQRMDELIRKLGYRTALQQYDCPSARRLLQRMEAHERTNKKLES